VLFCVAMDHNLLPIELPSEENTVDQLSQNFVDDFRFEEINDEEGAEADPFEPDEPNQFVGKVLLIFFIVFFLSLC
jgi:hypothetical protein